METSEVLAVMKKGYENTFCHRETGLLWANELEV